MTATATGPEREAATFDRLVRDAGDFDPLTTAGWNRIGRAFRSAMPDTARAAVLDVGCGTGRSRIVYEAQAASYAGLDISLSAVAVARRRNNAVVRGSAFQLPFAEASFDVVAFSSVLHHLDDRTLALVEAKRVLRPGGRVFAFDPNVLHPAMFLFRHPRSPLYRREGVSPDERPIRGAALRRDFEMAGLTAIGQRGMSGVAYRAVAPRLLNGLLPVYNALDAMWDALGAGIWFGSFLATWARRP